MVPLSLGVEEERSGGEVSTAGVAVTSITIASLHAYELVGVVRPVATSVSIKILVGLAGGAVNTWFHGPVLLDEVVRANS